MTGKWKTILREDCFRYCGETGLSARLRVYLVHAAYRYTCLLRKTQYHKEAGHRLRTKMAQASAAAFFNPIRLSD